MSRLSKTLIVIALSVGFGLGAVPAHAQIGDEGSAFWLHNDSQCTGGTLIYSDADVQDGGGLGPYTNAKPMSAAWCSQITPPGACCSVHVSTNGGGFGGNIIPYTWFTFDVYQGATIQNGFSNYQTGTLANAPGSGGNSKGPVGRQGKYFAGIAGEGAPPAAVTASLVANPSSVVRGESSLLSWSSENATSCTGTNFSTGNAVSGSVLVRPSSETSYILTCTNGSTTATDKETIAVIIPLPACSEPNICVGNNVVSACTGAVVEQCSTSCVSQTTTTNGGGSGQYQWRSAGEQTLEETCTGGRENFTPRCPANLGSCSVQNQTCWSVSGPAQCDSKKAAEFGLVQEYSCGGSTTSSGGQCPNGQTSVTTFNPKGSSCVGGTTIGRTSEMLDAVQIGMWPDGWLVGQCSELGAVAGDCCEYSQRSSNNIGGGFPANSYYQIRVVRGGSFSQEETSFTKTPQCVKGLEYSCSSVAGDIATQCVGTGGNPNPGGGGSSTTTTVPAYCAADDGEDDTNSCTVGRMCFGTDLYYQNNNCSRAFIESCAYGCALGSCINPDDGDGSGDDGSGVGAGTKPDAVLTANPALIKKGNTCNLTFSAQNVSSCTLTGNGIDRTVKATGGVISTVTFTTPALQVTTPYTLTCAGRTTIKKVIDCKIAPTFQEI